MTNNQKTKTEWPGKCERNKALTRESKLKKTVLGEWDFKSFTSDKLCRNRDNRTEHKKQEERFGKHKEGSGNECETDEETNN